MPKVFTIWVPPHPMLNVIFACGLRVPPAFLGSVAIIRMDSFHPIESETLLEAEPGKGNPLRAGPSPATIRARQKNKLRNTGCEKTKALLALAQTLFRHVLISVIACDFNEARNIAFERHHEA